MNDAHLVIIDSIAKVVGSGDIKEAAAAAEFFTLNRTGFDGDSIALKEDGVHERHNPSPPVPAAVPA